MGNVNMRDMFKRMQAQMLTTLELGRTQGNTAQMTFFVQKEIPTIKNDRNFSQNVHICALTQAARQGLSARIRFASANNMFNFAVCFRRPRYRVFRKRSCCFTTAKTCSTLARTEDFSRSLRLICALDRLELFLL